MKSHLSYLKYLLKHKYYVFLACLDMGVPIWNAIFHDWTKFLPSEWIVCVNTLYDQDGNRREYKFSQKFRYVRDRHYRRNKHHWQYWVLLDDTGAIVSSEMPDVHIREMIADWIGAGMMQHGYNDVTKWYNEHKSKMILHIETRKRVEDYLYVYGDFRY